MSRLSLITCVVLFCLLFLPSHAYATNGPLRRSSNPSYFQDASGKAVYLSGQHTWNGFYYNSGGAPYGDYNSIFSTLHNRGQNFTRLWTGDGVQSSVTTTAEQPKIWLSGPTCCNSAYIERLKNIAASAKSYDMYVSIMLFEGWWQGDPTQGQQFWNNHVFRNLESDLNKYFTTLNPEIFTRHKDFVRAVITALKPYDNVIFEICNECHNNGGLRPANTEWQKALIDYIKSPSGANCPSCLVGFTDNGDSDINNKMLNSNADWVSIQGNEFIDNPPTADPRKVHLIDTDHIQCASNLGCAVTADWIWKTFTSGYNPIIMDDWGGAGFGDRTLSAANASGPTVWMANTKVQNLITMRPKAAPCKIEWTWCLGNGSEFVAYFPSGTATPNLGAGWTYEMYSTTSKVAGSGNNVVYGRNGTIPPTTPAPTNPVPQPSNTSTPTPQIVRPTNQTMGLNFPYFPALQKVVLAPYQVTTG